MPSGLHEVLIELVEVAPELLPNLLRQTYGKDLPDFTHVRGCSETANIKIPVEHRADSVQAFVDADDKPVLVTVVEVQLTEKDSKQWVWPLFVAEARRLHKCQTVVLVIVPDAKTAEWARQPLDLGLGLSFVTPLVVDFSDRQPITDPREAEANLGAAMFAALNPKTPQESLDALSVALEKSTIDEAKQYAGLMLTALRGATQDYWRKLMAAGTYAYQNDYARELRAEGRSEGLTQGLTQGLVTMVLFALTDRGITVPDEARERIEACDDAETLKLWMHRAIRANTIEEVLDA